MAEPRTMSQLDPNTKTATGEIRPFEDRVIAEVQQLMKADVLAASALGTGHEVRCLALRWHLTMVGAILNDLRTEAGLGRDDLPLLCICPPFGEPRGSA